MVSAVGVFDDVCSIRNSETNNIYINASRIFAIQRSDSETKGVYINAHLHLEESSFEKTVCVSTLPMQLSG